MSTAARPTFHAAQGKASFGGSFSRSVSGKDQTAHTKLKFRRIGQASTDEMVSKDFKKSLGESETLLIKNNGVLPILPVKAIHENNKITLKLLKNEVEETIDLNDIKRKYDDVDADFDANDSESFASSEADDDNDNDDDDDEDDELELQRELERIKAERLEAQAKKEEEERQLAETLQREQALKSNPLVQLDPANANSSSKIRRKWNDDVVFKNQGREEPNKRKEFINDTIRNEFHRAFLKKYIK